ncbi:MAG: nitrogen-fixing NifU domain protein [Firmicutes bacterium]|nr:nitrogen-fixing NifU domain protein [Bacillota bacterium]
MYSEKVMEHFLMPRNACLMADPDGVGTSGDSSCGDNFKLFIQVQNGIITNISFLVFGCGAAIACGSMTTVLARGKSLSEAAKISEQDVVDALDGLPEAKQHCSNLGVTALKAAIQDYLLKKASGKR